MSEKWTKVWLENYHNKSEAAKDIDALMKKNYKGHKYVPWAVMVKWLYLMDSEAQLDVEVNDKEGNIVFTDSVRISQNTFKDKSSLNKDGVKLEASETDDLDITHFSHFVRVKCTFLGKTFVENYPIQDNAYSAPKYYDSNMVNKSIQRAKAKIISIATGLGYQLYETGDLQFEDDTKDAPKDKAKTIVIKPDKPEKKETKKEPTETPAKKDVKPPATKKETSSDMPRVLQIIREHGEAILPALQAVNPSLVKTYGFSIKLEDSDEDITDMLGKINNIDLFTKMFEKRVENILKENA